MSGGVGRVNGQPRRLRSRRVLEQASPSITRALLPNPFQTVRISPIVVGKRHGVLGTWA